MISVVKVIIYKSSIISIINTVDINLSKIIDYSMKPINHIAKLKKKPTRAIIIVNKLNLK